MASDVAAALTRVADSLDRLVLAFEKSATGQQEQKTAASAQEREKAVGTKEKEKEVDTSFGQKIGEALEKTIGYGSNALNTVTSAMHVGMSTPQYQMGVTSPVNRAMGEMGEYAKYGQTLTPQEVEIIAARVAAEQLAAKNNVNALYPMVNAGTLGNIFNRVGDAYTQYEENLASGHSFAGSLKGAWNTFVGNETTDYMKKAVQNNMGIDAFGR